MANFTKTFMDFSLGEIDQKNIALSINSQTAKGCSLLENMMLTKTRGLERRTGSIQIATTKYPVDPDNQRVTTHSFFIGKGLSYVGMMYVVDTTGFDADQILSMGDDSGYEIVPVDAKVLCIDWYKSEGFTDTYVNTLVLYIDKDVPLSSAYYGEFPRVLNNDWLDIYGFKLTPFQTFSIVTHSTGSIEPFVIYLSEGKVSWFLHRHGLTVTNPNVWSKLDTGNAFAVPFEQANLNPNVALKLARLDDVDIKITSQYYNTATSAFGDWSSVTNLDDPVPKPHPLSKRIDFIRVTILANTYILKYTEMPMFPSNIPTANAPIIKPYC